MGFLETFYTFIKGKGIEVTPDEVAQLAENYDKDKDKDRKRQSSQSASKETQQNIVQPQNTPQNDEKLKQLKEEYEKQLKEKESAFADLSKKLDDVLTYQRQKDEEQAAQKKAYEEEQEKKRIEEATKNAKAYIETNGVQKDKIAPKDETLINSLMEIGVNDFEKMKLIVDGMKTTQTQGGTPNTNTQQTSNKAHDPFTTPVETYLENLQIN